MSKIDEYQIKELTQDNIKKLCLEERPEKRIFSWEEGLSFYWRMNELMLSLKEKRHRISQGATPWKRGIFQREKLSSFPEGEWASTESQREMMQEKVKLVCQGTALWKKGIFLRWSIEFFTGGWVRWCWVPKRDDPENQKNDYKTEEKSRKGKYKHLF